MEQKKKDPEFFVMLKDGRFIGKSDVDAVDIVHPDDGLHIRCYLSGYVAVINEEQDSIVHVKEGSAHSEKLSEFNKRMRKNFGDLF